MNHIVLDVIFAVVGVLTIVLCAKKGFFKTLMGFLRLLLAIVAAYLFGGKLATFIADKFMAEPIRNSVYNKIEAMYQSAAESFDAQKILSSFPKFLMNDSMREQIGSMDETGEELVVSATDSISGVLTKIASSAVGYLIVFLVALLVLFLVSLIIGALIKKLFLLRTVDCILGGVVGALLAWIILFVGASIVKFFWGSEDFYTQSVIVKFLGNTSLPEQFKFLKINEWLEKAFQK